MVELDNEIGLDVYSSALSASTRCLQSPGVCRNIDSLESMWTRRLHSLSWTDQIFKSANHTVIITGCPSWVS